MATLTKKQKVFADEYLIDLNATQAAIRAGYSKKTAEWIGPQLLGKTHVAEAISERMKDREKRTEITQDAVLRELAKIGFANMMDYMICQPGGDPFLDFSKLTRDQAAALIEVIVEDYVDGRGEDSRQVRRVKFKLADKKGALVDIGKHLGMFTNKVEVFGKNGGPIEYSDIERAKRINALFDAARKRRDGQTADAGSGGD
jgi:phage terminase small subunit